jgi:hypothetical protein
MANKNTDFKRLLVSQKKQEKFSFIKTQSVKKHGKKIIKQQNLLLQKRKSHTVRDKIIMPGCKIIEGKILGQSAEKN